MSVINQITVGNTTYDVQDLLSRPILTNAEYEALETQGLIDPDVDYHISDLDVTGAPIDDDNASANSVYSSERTNKNTDAVTISVSLTGWTSTTSAQSGNTLYKKTLTVNEIYTKPNVDIGCASGSVLPTVVEQQSFNLLQYVTYDKTAKEVYLYASAIPTTAFYVSVRGVE